MNLSNPTDALENSLTSLTQEETRSWVQIGYLLDQVETTGHWQGRAASFTEWIRNFAGTFRLGEASLWRYLTSVRYYQKLQRTLSGRGVTCPELENLPGSVSPENLELLAKLARVAPDDVLQKIALRVVNGSIKRAEMRTTWEAYRPALAGRTARGTGVTVPTVDPTNPHAFDSVLEAQVFTALTFTGCEWTGVKKPYLYEVFLRVAPEFDVGIPLRFEFDAVAVTRAKKNSSIEFHGIEIRGNLSLSTTSDLFERERPYCDFLWLALDDRSLGTGDYDLPEYVGLLIAQYGEVRILRQAQRNAGECTGDLAKGLLLKTLRR